MDRDRALELAKKLAAFDSKNATQNEVELAAVRLAKIMNDHNLSMLDIKAEQMKGSVGSEKTSHSWKRAPAWIWFFVNETARCFRCQTVWFGSQIEIIGEKTDAALARYFIGAVLQIDLAKMSWRALQVAKKERGLEKDQYHGFHQSFFYGFASAIIKRLKDEYDQWYADLDKEKQGQARGLIVVKDAAIKDYLQEKHPSVKVVRRSFNGVHDHDAIARGEQAGRDFKLNKAIAPKPDTANKLN